MAYLWGSLRNRGDVCWRETLQKTWREDGWLTTDSGDPRHWKPRPAFCYHTFAPPSHDVYAERCRCLMAAHALR